jgi:hypothetical protein
MSAVSGDILTRATELTALLRELATDDTNPARATVRGAAHDLVVDIDDTVRALYAQRTDLCGAAREFDDATNRRVDTLLRHGRARRELGRTSTYLRGGLES